MSLTTQASNAARGAAIDAVAALLSGGFIDIYDGAQPAGPGTAITSQNKLAHLQLGTPAFAASVNGVATANAIGAGSALASGTAAWFRATKADGTAVLDGSCGVSGCNLTVNSVVFVSGAPVNVSGYTLTEPAAGA